jgi:hypothetical protein
MTGEGTRVNLRIWRERGLEWISGYDGRGTGEGTRVNLRIWRERGLEWISGYDGRGDSSESQDMTGERTQVNLRIWRERGLEWISGYDSGFGLCIRTRPNCYCKFPTRNWYWTKVRSWTSLESYDCAFLVKKLRRCLNLINLDIQTPSRSQTWDQSVIEYVQFKCPGFSGRRQDT